MSLQEFTRDVVPILQLVFTFIGLLSMVIVLYQIKQTTKWNKINSQFNFINNLTAAQLQRTAHDAAKKIGIDLEADIISLLPTQINSIFNDDDCFFAFKNYLNEYENIAAAIRVGCADQELAYAIHSAKFIRTYNVFSPFIEALRKKYNDDDLYCEFEAIAQNWVEKHHQLLNDRNKKLSNIKSKQGLKAKL